MKNRLTISTLVCPSWPLETILERAAAVGVQGVDFRGIQQNVDHTTLPAFSTQVDKTVALLRGRGLEAPCMCSSVALMTPDPLKWAGMLEEYLRYLKVADAFGSPFIRIFPGRTPADMSRDAATVMARQHARQLASLAKSHRAKPLLETHDDWGASAEVIQLIDDCDPDAFGVVWDVRHTWAAKELPQQVIATLGPRLKHVHVKDSVMRDGREVPALLGEGIVSVRESLIALRDANYDGWICLETEKRWYPEVAPVPEESLPQFVAFVRGV